LQRDAPLKEREMASEGHIERVLRTIQHRQPDRTPYYISFTIEAARKMAQVYGAHDLDELIDNDMVRYSIAPALMF